MAAQVWIVPLKRGGGKKKVYVLRWKVPVLDAEGNPVLDARGRAKFKWRQENTHSGDKTTARRLRERKILELAGIVAPPEPEPSPLYLVGPDTRLLAEFRGWVDAGGLAADLRQMVETIGLD